MSDDPDWIDELYAEGAEALPPAALDEKIRAAARQPVRHPWYRSPGRLTALATAASLVIAVSVIYFEPDQSALEAPVPALDAGTVFESEEIRPSGVEEIAETAAFRSDKAVDQAEKIEAVERKSMPARKSANEPAASLAADAAVPAPPAAEPIPETVLERPPETTRMVTRNGRSTESDQADMQIGEIRFESPDEAGIDKEAAVAELISLCGALPGEEETREISADETGWRVTVTVGGDARTWRCIDGAWIETTSEQQ